jgi:hypothetical protein
MKAIAKVKKVNIEVTYQAQMLQHIFPIRQL